eukprot:201376-Amphidinium_carterae.2
MQTPLEPHAQQLHATCATLSGLRAPQVVGDRKFAMPLKGALASASVALPSSVSSACGTQSGFHCCVSP